jgi:MYXO-CTERM domain-containing protein
MRKAFALVLLAAAACYGDNLVQNPGFETGDFTGWSVNVWSIDTGTAHSGSYSAVTGCVGPALSTGCNLSQTLVTVAGGTYDFSVWVQENAGPTSELLIQWNGATVADFFNPANYTYPGTWVELTIPSLVATGSSTLLSIYGRQDPGGIWVDDISVSSSIPEPATLGFAALGLIALALRRRR